MVTTGARSPYNTNPAAPLDVAYWVQFRRGDYRGSPAYTGTYGFDWVEWKRNSANNPATAYDDLTAVMGKSIGDYVQCYDPGLPNIPAQPATATQPAIPAKLGIAPHYAAVAGLYKQRYHQELHQGYTKRIVQGNDYYVPWLSVRPHQSVKLKLEVEFLNKEPVKPTNLFTVAAHPDYLVTINGQTNNAAPPPATPVPVLSTTSSSANPAPAAPPPAPIRLPPVNKQVLDVTIECLRPSGATSLRVEDEHKNLVGQLNIADNTLVYELPLRVVYVLKGIPMNPKAPIGTTPPRPLYARPGSLATVQGLFQKLNFIDYLNTRTLNQALITCTVHTPTAIPPSTQAPAPYQVLIDEAEWKAAGFVKNGLLQPQGLHEYCEQKANALFGPFSGLTLFAHELNIPPEGGNDIAASGAILPVAAKTLLIYRKGLDVGKKSTIAHELGHVLGLTHAFPVANENPELAALQTTIPALQALVPQEQAALAKLQQQAATPPTPTEQAATDQKIKGLKNLNNRINGLLNHAAVYANNPFKFTQFSTENMMDYDPSSSVDQRLSFWHWQWALLQTDVATYYGTKTAAR